MLKSLLKILSQIKDLRADAAGFFIRNHQRELTHTYSLLGLRMISTIDPELMQHILIKNYQNYHRGRGSRAAEAVLGQGLVTTNGAQWKMGHQMAISSFTRKFIKDKHSTLTETIQEELTRLPSTSEIHLLQLSGKLALKSLLKLLLNIHEEIDEQELYHLLKESQGLTHQQLMAPLELPSWLPTKTNRRLKKIKKSIQGIIGAFIPLAQGQDSLYLGKLQSKLLEGSINQERLIEELVNLIVAGFETTASVLSFAMILLSQHPAILTEATSFSEGTTPADLFHDGEYDILDQVILETMRLHPPIWIFMREAYREDRVNELVIPKKSNTYFVTYASQRSPLFWQYPLEFIPQRFTREFHEKVLQEKTYYPFGMGPRMCVGEMMAMSEIKIILHQFLRQYTWVNLEPHELLEDFKYTLAPANNLRFSLTKKSTLHS